MAILSTVGISKSFGDRILFENGIFSIEKGDKIGFIGANGVGKTTLFKIIIGEEPSSKGEVIRSANLKIGYLEQYVCKSKDKTALEETLTIFSDLINIGNELEEINSKLLTQSDNKLIERQAYLTEKYQLEGGLTYLSRTESVLSGLGFTKEEFYLPISALSGGQRAKIGLAKLLLCSNDLILLDEPTNHLDIDSVLWLEDFLTSFPGAVIIISHDRFFLDKVTEKTMELENKKLYFTSGNYSRYIELKEQRIAAELKEFNNKSKEIKRIEGIIEQQKRWNREKNIKTAESKQKQIERIAKTMEKPESENHKININFPVKSQSGFNVLTVENDRLEFDGMTLYKNASFNIERGERVFLIGPNGIGKTSLIKRLISKENPSTFSLGVGVTLGYFDQFQDKLNLNLTPFEEIHNEYLFMSDTSVRNALAAFEFKGDDVFKQNSALSGGERAKVSLCKIVLSGNNFLVLDEPTNHLDIYSRTALEKALEGYEGTLFIVSHDRYFINKIADKIILLTPEKTITIKGNFDDYLLWCEKQKEENKPEIKETEPIKKGKEDYLNKKKLRSETAKLRTQVKKAEEEIANLEQLMETLKDEIAVFGSDYEKLAEITEKMEKCESEILMQMQLWENGSAELEKLLNSED